MIQFCFFIIWLLKESYLSIETVSCCLLLWTARMDMDWNWKVLGQLFQVIIPCLQESPRNIMVFAPWWNLLGIFYITVQEKFVYCLGHLIMASAHKWPKTVISLWHRISPFKLCRRELRSVETLWGAIKCFFHSWQFLSWTGLNSPL